MTHINDTRRDSASDNTGSRRKFAERNRGSIKKAVEKMIGEQNIADIGKEGVDVVIPRRDIREPSIHHGHGGTTERVLPGNKEFQAGDRLKKPNGGGGGGGNGSGAGNEGGGEDDFVYRMSAEDVENFIFADLELPNMTKKAMADSKRTKPKRAGYASSGIEQDRHLVQSKKEKLKRMVATKGPMNRDILELLQEKRDILAHAIGPEEKAQPRGWEPRKIKIAKLEKAIAFLMPANYPLLAENDKARIAEIDDEIEQLEERKALIPVFNQTTDSRYRNKVQKPIPTSKAVMFCLMDVSGSMDEETKNNAKLFYHLLYRFLKRHYEQTDVVFIRHHTEAEEVDEHAFFHERSTGGTIVSSALEEMKKVMAERYLEEEWNIYGAQASDGDNWGDDDNRKCSQLLSHDILPKVQGYFYTEITRGRQQNLWRTYESIAAQFSDRFWMANIRERRDVAKVFREFFKKRDPALTGPGAGMSAFNPQP